MADYIIRYVLYWEVPKKHMEDRNVMKQPDLGRFSARFRPLRE